MTLFLTVLQIVAPVLVLAGAGIAWVRLGFEYRLQFVTRLATGFAMPCLVFTALMQADVTPQTLGTMALAGVAGYAALAGVFYGLVRVLRLDLRTWLVPMTFGNTGNLGLPLALFAFGETGLAMAVVVFAVGAIGQFTFGLWVVAGGGSPLRLLREPLVWASLLGALFLWQGWRTPDWLTSSLELAGQMAIPLMLLTLGVAVARLRPVRLGPALGLSLLRLAVCLAVGTGVALLLAPDRIALAVLIVQFATPVPVTAYLMSERYGTDSESVAGLVVVSTLLGLASFPLTLAFLI